MRENIIYFLFFAKKMTKQNTIFMKKYQIFGLKLLKRFLKL